jgi:membrane protein DedA with SNARE-associated domain
MTLASLIQEYGYAAVFAGTFIEGETVLIMAGFAAHRGYLVLPSILEARARRMRALLDRYHLPVILGVRFLYGLRTVGPMVIGMSHVPWPRFFLLNLLGAISWAIAVTSAGYLFGEALSLLMTNVRHYEAALLGVIALLGIAFWLMYRWRQRNTSR